MANIVKGDTVTSEVIASIVGQFEYADEQMKKAAVDKVNNSVFDSTDLDELTQIAKSFSVEAH